MIEYDLLCRIINYKLTWGWFHGDVGADRTGRWSSTVHVKGRLVVAGGVVLMTACIVIVNVVYKHACTALCISMRISEPMHFA